MRRSLFAIVACVLCSMHAEVSPGRSAPQGFGAGRLITVDARLRSAFLLRATGWDKTDQRLPLLQLQRQLQHHFDAVLEILDRNTERALRIALDRLEMRIGEQWTTEQLAAWKERLTRERHFNLTRLRAYQTRGLFPINEHDGTRSVPVFVDHYDTACAVGYLMRESGWWSEVAQIQAAHNLVYVSDVMNGPVLNWVSYSGLTQEEAALIQPGYGIAPAPDARAPFVQLSGADAISARGLQYGRFAVGTPTGTFAQLANEYILAHPAGVDAVLVPPTNVNFLDVSLRYGPAYADFSFGGENFAPVYDRWLNVSGGLAQADENHYSIFQYGFEVAAISPDQRLTAITLLSNYVIGNLGFGTLGGVGFAGIEVYSLTDELLGAGIIDGKNQPFGYLQSGRRNISFQPQERLKVKVTAFALDGFSVYGLGQEINLVPEPSALGATVFATLLALSSWQRRRRNSRSDLSQ